MEHNLVSEHFNQTTTLTVGHLGDLNRISNLISNAKLGKVSIDINEIKISFYTLRKNKPAQGISYIIDPSDLTTSQITYLNDLMQKQMVSGS